MKTRPRNKATMSYREDSPDFFTSHGRSVRSCRVEKAKTTTRKSHRLRSLDLSAKINGEQSQHSEEIFEESEPSPKSRKLNNKPKVSQSSDKCKFCNTDADVYELGELKKCEDITAHMYCLFFACGLTQNGELNEGIDGFKLADIRSELKRGSKLKCSYCGKRGAVVGCRVSNCKISYHLNCGIQNGAFNQFHDKSHSFPSSCIRHRPKLAAIPRFQNTKLCTICQENVKYIADRNNILYFKCCQTYFHRDCLVKLAYHQGEFHLKCPNCKNDKDFIDTLKINGIYVPCRDASWELSGEMNSGEVTFECCATVCNCTNGRNHNGDNEWELFACDRCGSSAVHVACAGLSEGSEWVCETCSNVR